MQTASKTILPYGTLLRQFQSPPAGKLYCLHGNRSVFRLSLYAASRALLNGHFVAVVDGSNSLDLYYIAEYARRVAAMRDSQVTPEEVLERMYISRAFTCYQMEATITERLWEFVRSKHIPVVMIFGLLDTFYDEQAPLFQVKASVQRILEVLYRMKQSHLSLLLAMHDIQPASKERAQLAPIVWSAMDEVFSIDQAETEVRIVRETELKSVWWKQSATAGKSDVRRVTTR